MRITHQTIADRVGVSRTVVTEALHRTPGARINTKTRREILRAAKEMGYQPRNVSTRNIGYALSILDIKREASIMLLTECEQTVRARDYRLTFASVVEDKLDDLREVFNPKTVDGVIFTRWYGGKIKKLLSPKVPWVLISDEYGVDDTVDLVALDTIQTTRNLVAHLIRKGHVRIGLIVSEVALKFHDAVIEGAQLAVRDAGLPSESLRLIPTGLVQTIGPKLVPIMAEADAPTGLIAVSPGQAIATIYALRCAGYRVPDDVSMVSLVDNERFLALPPVLTCTDGVGSPLMEAAVKRLMEKIDDPDSPPQHIYLPGQVIERDSVADLTK